MGTAHDAECVIAVEGGQHVLRCRATGVDYARGTEAQVRQAAHGVYAITEAPRLGPVQPAGTTLGGHPEFMQMVDESKTFQGKQFVQGMDEWTAGVLYPDHLGISFTERLADVPHFTAGVQQLTGRPITSVRGTASVAGIGDPPLLGDWIRSGRFQPDRLARRFERDLGGRWDVILDTGTKHSSWEPSSTGSGWPVGRDPGPQGFHESRQRLSGSHESCIGDLIVSGQHPEYWPFPVLPPEQRSEQHRNEVRFLDEALGAGFKPCKFMDGEYRIEAPNGRSAWLIYRGRLRGGSATRWEIWLNEGSDRVTSFWADEFACAAEAVLGWVRGGSSLEASVVLDGHLLRSPEHTRTASAGTA